MDKLVNQYVKNIKGITLIALIITIIILLILAGVAISSLSESGLFEKAKIAKQKQTETEVKEKINLLISEYAIEREQGKTLLQFLTEKKDSGEIDDFVDNNDGTFDVIINGYTTTINESDLSTTEPQILSDIMVTCLAKEFANNKIQALITVKSQSGGIKEIRLINNVIVQGNNKSSITFDHTIEANTEYQVEVELTNGTTSTKTIKYEDTEAPTATIEITKKIIFNGGKIQANVNIEDNRSEVNIRACKWVAVQNSDNLGITDESLYTGGTLSSTTQTVETENLTEPGEYYIHLLLKDNVGNTAEVISEKVEIKEGYEISTPEEFQAIETNLAGHYYVTKDIDMEGFNFTPINGTFTGTIDGMGHTINNLSISKDSGEWAAMFYGINNATIENILFKNYEIISGAAYNYIFAYISDGHANFKKVGVKLNLNSSLYGAEFVGYVNSNATFENCYARVSTSGQQLSAASGFIRSDWYQSTFLNCYFAGNFTCGGRMGPFDWNIDSRVNSMSGCYYNSDLLIPNDWGLGYNTGIPLTTQQMADSSNYTGWNFDEENGDWYMGEDGYPELKF